VYFKMHLGRPAKMTRLYLLLCLLVTFMCLINHFRRLLLLLLPLDSVSI